MKYLILTALLATPAIANQSDALGDRVAACWTRDALSTQAQAATVSVAFQIDSEGFPVADSVHLVSWQGDIDVAVPQAFEAAKRAIIRCGAGGYGITGQQELTFTPDGIRAPLDRVIEA